MLGVVPARMPDRDPHSVNKVLRVYERPRKQRVETLIDLTAASDYELHLGEGAAKEERDKQFTALKQGIGLVPDKWADADVQRTIYGHDCMQVAQVSFDKLFQSIG